jgi:hypothetical protein
VVNLDNKLTNFLNSWIIEASFTFGSISTSGLRFFFWVFGSFFVQSLAVGQPKPHSIPFSRVKLTFSKRKIKIKFENFWKKNLKFCIQIKFDLHVLDSSNIFLNSNCLSHELKWPKLVAVSSSFFLLKLPCLSKWVHLSISSRVGVPFSPPGTHCQSAHHYAEPFSCLVSILPRVELMCHADDHRMCALSAAFGRNATWDVVTASDETDPAVLSPCRSWRRARPKCTAVQQILTTAHFHSSACLARLNRTIYKKTKNHL